MAGALLGYFFYVAIAFVATMVLLIGLFDDTRLGKVRDYSRPIIARTITTKKEAHRHLPATSGTKQASITKDTNTFAMTPSQEAAVDGLKHERFVRLHELKVLDAPRFAVLGHQLDTPAPTR